ncbi:MAG: hypothetical protein AAFZ07_01000 [Actinomycetota bacterium]
MSETGRAIYEWRITPAPAHLRAIDLVLLVLVGTALILTITSFFADAQLRTYVLPAALLGGAAMLWQQRAWSMAFRLAVTERGDAVFDDGRGHRQIVPLAGCEVGMCRRARGRLRLGAPWRWGIELEANDGRRMTRELPALAGWFNPPVEEVEHIVAQLAAKADADGSAVPPVAASQFPLAPRHQRDRTRFEWRHPRLAEIARARRRVRTVFFVFAGAIAAATGIAIFSEDVSALSPEVGVIACAVVVAFALFVDWLFWMPFRWTLRVDPEGNLRITSGAADRTVRLSEANDVIVGRRHHHVADGEVGTVANGWMISVQRPDGSRWEAPIPTVAGWAGLTPDDAASLERVLRRRAGLPVDP